MGATSREEFEATLAWVRRNRAGDVEGVFGPGSVTWRVNREGYVILGGGVAALLQAAHPYVAHAVVEHSATMHDAQMRLRRTLESVYRIVFGDWASAEKTARTIRRIHDHIKGEIEEPIGRWGPGDPYSANDLEAQQWVAATLMHTALRIYERVNGPLSRAERNRLAWEHKLFCGLFGISPDACPDTWAEFEADWHATLSSDTIVAGSHAREIASHIMYAPTRSTTPFYAWLRAFTAHLLPARLRREFRLPYGPLDAALARSSFVAMRAGRHALPRALRYFPGYLDAQRRLAGRSGPHRSAALAWRTFFRAIIPQPSPK